MKKYFSKTPRFMMRFFSKYTWRFQSNEKEIFLTFDDGPTPEITQFVLSELKKYNAKATFFCIGKNIKYYPEIFNEIIADGHSIGNHTQNHLNGWKTTTENYIANFLECHKTITQFNKIKIKHQLFRPPYGKIKKSQAEKILKKGYKIIMWDVLSADFDNTISKERCLQNVLNNAKKGTIIVFHDSLKASKKVKYALPKVLKAFSDKGFVFKKI